MHFTSTLFVAASWIAVCNAIDLNFWTNGGCSGSKVSCTGQGVAFCCTSGAPFCQSANCDGCVVGNDIYTFNRAACTGASFASCRAAVGNGCCRSAGGGNTCAIVVYRGAARKRGEAIPVNPDACEASVRPNNAEYTDHNGTAHHIYIPTGAFEEVAELMVNEDWDALNAYPEWDNQPYVEADITRKVKKDTIDQ